MPNPKEPTPNPLLPDKTAIMTAMVHGLLTGPACQAFMRPNALNTGIDLDAGQLVHVGEVLANGILNRAVGQGADTPLSQLAAPSLMQDPTNRGH